jgi:hypothetical protein
MSILANLFQSKDSLKIKIKVLKIGGLASAVVFIIIVGIVLFKAISTAFLFSERTSANTLPKVESEQLQKAIDLVEEWKRQAEIRPTIEPTAEPIEPTISDLP